MSDSVLGTYRGIVVDNNDPTSGARVTLKVPQILGDAESNWAAPSVPTSFIPEPGDQLWISFDGGDVNAPVYTPPGLLQLSEAIDGLDSTTFTGSPPKPPTNLTAGTATVVSPEGITSGVIGLAWIAPTENQDGSVPIKRLNGYRVQYSYNGTDWAGGAFTPETSWLVDGFLPSTHLYLRVQSLSASSGPGLWSTVEATTPAAATSDTPSTPTATGEINGVRVRWDGKSGTGSAMPAQFSHVEISRATSAGFASSVVVGSLKAQGDFYDKNAGAGTTYFYRLTAVSMAAVRSTSSASASASGLVDPKFAATDQAISDLSSSLTGVQGKVDGKSTIYVQSTDPNTPAGTLVAADQGDVWINNGATPRVIKTWTGTAWIEADERTASTLSTVLTKVTTFYGTIVPSATAVGDLWVDAGNQNRLKRATATGTGGWVFVDDARISLQASDIGTLQSNLTTANGRIDGKAVIWVQNTQPTGLGAADQGDIWINTSTANRVTKVWDGSAFQDITDQKTLDTLSTVNTKVTTFFGSATPSATAVGDLWIDSGNGNVLKRATAIGTGSWVAVDDTRITTQATAIGTLQTNLTTANGRIDGKSVIYVQTTQPTGLVAADQGDIWINTSTADRITKVWDGSAFQNITDQKTLDTLGVVNTKITTFYAASSATPSATAVGDLWIVTDDSNRIKRASAVGTGSWVYVDDARIATNATAVSTLQTNLTTANGRIDGKAVIWVQTTAPTGLVAADQGDIWINTSTANRVTKVWDGAAFQDITDQKTLDTLTTVNTKITTFYAASTATPSATAIGDLWIVTDDNNRIKRASGIGTGSWVFVDDARIAANATAVATVQSGLVTANGRIDGKSVIYVQTADPNTPAGTLAAKDTGDIWVDTTGALRRYKSWTGSAWIAADDDRTASTLATVNTKITTFYAAAAAVPTAGAIGDLWIVTDDNNRIKRANSTGTGGWVFVDDQRIAANATAVATVQSGLVTANGRIDGKSVIYVQSTDPNTPAGTLASKDTGDIWIDTTGGLRRYKSWTGSAWIAADDDRTASTLSTVNTKITTFYAASTATPSAAAVGDLWIVTNDSNRIKRASAIGTGGWVFVDDARVAAHASSITTLQSDLTTANGRIDGKSVVYVQSTDPNTPAGTLASKDTGDIWIDTTGGLRRYKSWTGSAWIAADDDRTASTLATVGSKITTFYAATTTAPTATAVGDLWIVTDLNQQIRRWSGTAWVTLDVATQSYVVSRGTDLVTNGTGALGNNTNFSWATINKGDAPNGSAGSFVAPAGSSSSRFTDEYIPYDPGKRFRLSFATRQTGTSSTAYFYGGINPADGFKNDIASQHYVYVANTLTTLAAPLNVGDTTVTLTSSANWYGSASKTTTNVNNRRIIFWDYTDPGGKLWPELTYSRNVTAVDLWAEGGVVGNVITLRAPYAGPAKASGTKLSNGTQGGTYPYMSTASNLLVPNVWTTYAETVSGTVAGGVGASFAGGLPPGTAFCRILWLPNRTSAGAADAASAQAFALVSFSDTSAAAADITAHAASIGQLQTDLTTANGRLDGKAVIYVQSADPNTPAGTLKAIDQGDIWINNGTSPRIIKTWTGTAWIEADDRTATTLSTVNTKVTTFFGSATPSATAVGDLWIDAGNNNVLKRATAVGTASWVTVDDTRINAHAASIGQLQTDLTTANGRIDGKAVVYVQSTDPNTPAGTLVATDQGDVWINNGATTRIIKSWTGTAWIEADSRTATTLTTVNTKITTFYAASTATPSATAVGDLWIVTDDNNRMKRANATGTASWVYVDDARVAVVTTTANTALSTANGKNTVTYSLNAPVADGIKAGDVWFRKNALGNIIGQWEWPGTAPWASRAISYEAIASIDIGTATVGTLDAARVGTNTLTTRVLAVGDNKNLVPNGGGELGGVTAGYLTGSGISFETVDSPPDVPGVIKCTAGQSTKTTTGITDAGWDCSPGEEFYIEVWLKANVANSRIYVEFRDQAGASAGTFSAVDAEPFVGSSGYAVSSALVPTVWSKYSAKLVASATATRIRVGSVFFNHTNGTVTNAVQSIAIRTRRRGVGQLIVDGAIDGKVITGATVQTTATASRGLKFDTNGLKAYNSSGVNTVAINADGSATFSGNITSGSTITGAVFQSATSGPRIRIAPNPLTPLDPNAIEFVEDMPTGIGVTANVKNPSVVGKFTDYGATFTRTFKLTMDSGNLDDINGSRIVLTSRNNTGSMVGSASIASDRIQLYGKVAVGGSSNYAGTNALSRTASATQTVPTAAWTKLVYGATTYTVEDDGGIYTPGNWTAFVDGIYTITVAAIFPNATGSHRMVKIASSTGSTTYAQNYMPTSAPTRSMSVSWTGFLTNGAVISAYAYQDSGATHTMAAHTNLDPQAMTMIRHAS